MTVEQSTLSPGDFSGVKFSQLSPLLRLEPRVC